MLPPTWGTLWGVRGDGDCQYHLVNIHFCTFTPNTSTLFLQMLISFHLYCFIIHINLNILGIYILTVYPVNYQNHDTCVMWLVSPLYFMWLVSPLHFMWLVSPLYFTSSDYIFSHICKKVVNLCFCKTISISTSSFCSQNMELVSAWLPIRLHQCHLPTVYSMLYSASSWFSNSNQYFTSSFSLCVSTCQFVPLYPHIHVHDTKTIIYVPH